MIEQKEGETSFPVKIHYDDMVSNDFMWKIFKKIYTQ